MAPETLIVQKENVSEYNGETDVLSLASVNDATVEVERTGPILSA